MTISLGDSENDICMLESTDYACYKRGKYKLPLKKKKNVFSKEQKALMVGKNHWTLCLKWRIKISDFYQNGIVATLHNFSDRKYDELEKELIDYSKFRPIVILPSLYSELKEKRYAKIIEEISKVKFLQNIVIGLDQANREQFEDAKRFFSNLPQRHEILWNDGPGLKKLDSKLAEQKFSSARNGKRRRNVWYCMGYILALGDTEAIALHDCDKHLLQ